MIYKAPPAPWRQWLALISTLVALVLFAPSGATATARLKAKQAAGGELGYSSLKSENVVAAASADRKRGLDSDQQQHPA
ncbi:hypothetical protein BGZ96_010169 [Linnemannia gamsii]|uniref:Uncharacterized protein n=1 Tax=Linnemannia gamsii TaxID=64522 RepID=A0ABQ7JV89_9FUNG|nr:hypothetical protein BGZ96_010169 [Linnemannia gamsii]